MTLVALRLGLLLAGLGFLFSCKKEGIVPGGDLALGRFGKVRFDAARTTPDATANTLADARVVLTAPDATAALASAGSPSTMTVVNGSTAGTTVYVSFGAGSAITADTWKLFCQKTARLNCNFALPAGGAQALPLGGRHLNATISFSDQGCGATKAEFDVNNPAWYDTYDVSLVDGYSNKVSIRVATATRSTILGPPLGAAGNEKVFGLFPLGCDICTARQSPPCGIPPGKTGCKHGTQYKPDVPCQYQGAAMGGGGAAITVSLVR